VVLSGILGVSLATWGTSFTGLPPLWGAVGLSAASGCAGWIEFFLLKNHLITARAINPQVEKRFITLLALTSVLSAAICYPLKNYFSVFHPALAAGIILPLYGGLYAGITVACKIPEAIALFSKIKRAIVRIVGPLFRRRST
jgi:putative peptidoglycan lipid II flippase